MPDLFQTQTTTALQIEQIFDYPNVISLTNLQITIEETKINKFLLGYQAFVRDYISKQTVYNERHILHHLDEY